MIVCWLSLETENALYAAILEKGSKRKHSNASNVMLRLMNFWCLMLQKWKIFQASFGIEVNKQEKRVVS